MPLIFTPITSIPDVIPGDNISKLIVNGLKNHNISLLNNDILVITQKIISKSEDRFVNLKTVKPSKEALELARQYASERGELIGADDIFDGIVLGTGGIGKGVLSETFARAQAYVEVHAADIA